MRYSHLRPFKNTLKDQIYFFFLEIVTSNSKKNVIFLTFRIISLFELSRRLGSVKSITVVGWDSARAYPSQNKIY